MAERKKVAWAACYWRWIDGVDRTEDADPDTQQEEIWRRFPSKALAVAGGKKMAADPNNSGGPGVFRIMRGLPDMWSYDGFEWVLKQEVGP